VAELFASCCVPMRMHDDDPGTAADGGAQQEPIRHGAMPRGEAPKPASSPQASIQVFED